MEFEVDGARVFAAGTLPAEAAQPVVVLIHGAAMDHSVWVYHTRYFMHVGRAVIALDLPGHGRSAGRPLSTIEDMATWLLRCLDALDIERAALAGHSMGALVALASAAAASERIARLALLGCAVPMPVSEVLLAAARDDLPAAHDMMTVWGHGPRAQIGGNPVAGIHIMNFALRLFERAAAGVLHTDLGACNAYAGGIEAAARVAAPTTLICGAEDRMTPVAAARGLVQHFPAARLELIRGSGHIMMSERPEETHRQLVAALG
jgi:pimeloyl-ACP methyl ester carboxylesterase